MADNVDIMEYIHDMAKYLSAADLVISRSGALSVAEVTVCGVPAVFIPSPLGDRKSSVFQCKGSSGQRRSSDSRRERISTMMN